MTTTTTSFDTLTAAEELQAAGMEAGQAKAVSQIIGRSRETDSEVLERLAGFEQRLSNLEKGQGKLELSLKFVFWALGVNIVLTGGVLIQLIN